MSYLSKMFKTLLALLIFVTASLATPSMAAAKSHGDHHVSSLMKKHKKHKKHKHKKHKHKKHKHHKHKKHGGGDGGGMGGNDDDDDDDDDDTTTCKIVWTKRGPVQVCNTDDDDD
jgi:Ni/Co efflux regulator RcnB